MQDSGANRLPIAAPKNSYLDTRTGPPRSASCAFSRAILCRKVQFAVLSPDFQQIAEDGSARRCAAGAQALKPDGAAIIQADFDSILGALGAGEKVT